MSAAITWLGDCAVVVEVADGDEREHLARMLEEAFPDLRVRCGMREVLVEAPRPLPDLRARVAGAVAEPAGSTRRPGRDPATVRIEVDYCGTDLADVAAVLAVSVDDVVHAHEQQHWRVAMIGFAPGFGYLEPIGEPTLPWSALARRDSPRPAVSGGSVALAAGMSAVYPQTMPGGWHLIGRTDQVMFDVAAAEAPALLAAGDRVRFVRRGTGR
ncbi:MAG: 5-oxoprolinase subunit B family protein [Actinomycetes bacterium]